MAYSWAPGSGRRSTWAVSRRVLVKDTANGIDLSFSSGAQLREFMTRKNEYYLQSVRDITPRALLPGARELLQEIHSAGIKLALGSASKNAPEVIDRLGIRAFFDAIADGHSVERQKPAPDLFLHAAAQLHLPPQECAVVEDAEAGIQAAKAGGFGLSGWVLQNGCEAPMLCSRVLKRSIWQILFRHSDTTARREVKIME